MQQLAQRGELAFIIAALRPVFRRLRHQRLTAGEQAHRGEVRKSAPQSVLGSVKHWCSSKALRRGRRANSLTFLQQLGGSLPNSEYAARSPSLSCARVDSNTT